jgi:hypothetical protein
LFVCLLSNVCGVIWEHVFHSLCVLICVVVTQRLYIFKGVTTLGQYVGGCFHNIPQRLAL